MTRTRSALFLRIRRSTSRRTCEVSEREITIAVAAAELQRSRHAGLERAARAQSQRGGRACRYTAASDTADDAFDPIDDGGSSDDASWT